MKINRQDAGQDQSARPTRVQDIEPFGLVLAEHRGHDGIDERFHGAIAEGQDQAAPVEQLVGQFLVAGPSIFRMSDEISADAHDGPGDVAQESDDHGQLVADAVDDEAEADDAHGKWPDADA